MTVSKCFEQRHLSTGSMSVPPAADSVRIFQVQTSTSTDDDNTALTAVDPVTSVAIPQLLDTHPTRTWLNCQNVACRVVDGTAGRKWEVTATYAMNFNILPWEIPALQSGSQNGVDRPIDYDVVNGNAIINSAYQPYDPTPNAPRADSVISVQKNLLSFDTTIPQQYADTVNSATFMSNAEGFVRCDGIPFQEQIFTDQFGVKTTYYSVTFNFTAKNPNGEGWQARVLDAGFVSLGTSGALVPITLSGREPIFTMSKIFQPL
jgi:hypothetical protein